MYLIYTSLHCIQTDEDWSDRNLNNTTTEDCNIIIALATVFAIRDCTKESNSVVFKSIAVLAASLVLRHICNQAAKQR